ncbi:MAG TPA: molybdopterin-binding protein, partial [Kofleriaceae bacterium]|nr:molybdopterin-binding protein [Kofleriaceae bacterium]
MDSLPVHIAVLTIANDAASAERATAQAIVERARAAGHEVVDEETVKDSEGAIRDQLVRWIAEPEIDVVIVAASIDSNAASSALAPLIMQTLPGFTDLFRWLTFQEIGASAMLSAAEAAQCESTFVFVLPAHEAAVRAAMDKLILPQLDSNTKPKNLVSQMPRLKDAAKRAQTEPSAPMTTPAAAHHAVPVPIVAEKTSGGSGLPPKLPARTRQPTANIIARKPADPPTKQIDLAKLEKQIELSNVNEAQTKQIQVSAHDAKTKVVDMSAHQAKTRVVDGGRVLPRIPPGADDSAFDEDESLTFAEPPATMAKRISSPSGKGSPAATPPFATPIARSGGDRHTTPTPPAATPQLRAPVAERADRHTA